MGESSVREIVVPGSTSNLGPGFDALSVAVDVFLRARVTAVRKAPAQGPALAFAGRIPPGENRILTAFDLAAGRFGRPDKALDVHVSCDIPTAAGLGSSAAAAVAGLRLYEIAAGAPLPPERLLALASELDGHPDNAAAALLGGMTLSCVCDDGHILARAWDWPEEIRLIVGTPDVELQTKAARGVLPDAVPLRDAVANMQRALLLVRALETGRYGDLREALKDRLHQPARMALVPGLKEALAIEHPSVLGVCLSGAGPSILVLAAPGRAAEAASLLAAVYDRLGMPHTIRNLAAHPALADPLPVAAAQ